MSAGVTSAVYWDSSAILSALFRDRHSDEASKCARSLGVHLLSTLAWAEVHAVIARIERERALAKGLVVAGSLQSELPELTLLSFDARLATVAQSEGLA